MPLGLNLTFSTGPSCPMSLCSSSLGRGAPVMCRGVQLLRGVPPGSYIRLLQTDWCGKHQQQQQQISGSRETRKQRYRHAVTRSVCGTSMSDVGTCCTP